MKQLYLSLAFMTLSFAVSAQLTVYMQIYGITASAGDKITAFEQNGAWAFSTSPAGTTSSGKAELDNIKITKPQSLSSKLIKNMLLGQHIAKMSFLFYDNTNTLVYQINVSEASVSKFSVLSPQCPSCQGLSNEIWFNFTEIEWIDPVNKTDIFYNVNQKFGKLRA